MRQPVVPALRAALRGVGMATARWRTGPRLPRDRGQAGRLDLDLPQPGRHARRRAAVPRTGADQGDVLLRRRVRPGCALVPVTLPDPLGSPGPSRRRRRPGDRRARPRPTTSATPMRPARAAALVPDARIIVALRDPVRRAHSHYQERVRQGIETLPTFAAAIAAEPDRLAGEWERMLDEPDYVSAAHLNFGYVAQSEYDRGLEPMVGRLPAGTGCSSCAARTSTPTSGRRCTRSAASSGSSPVELPEPRHYNDTGSVASRPGAGATNCGTGWARRWIGSSGSSAAASAGSGSSRPAATRNRRRRRRHRRRRCRRSRRPAARR